MFFFSGWFGKAVLGVVFSFTFVYIFIPLSIYFVPYLVHLFFFLHIVRNPFNDYTNLSAHGVASIGRNFYLDVLAADGLRLINRHGAVGKRVPLGDARLGIWHILPAGVSAHLREADRPVDDELVEAQLAEGSEAVLIYLHGNSFDRTTDHRCQLYNVLSEMNFHVLAIDYRGFGDSSGTPSEDGLAIDAHAVYEYARRLAPAKNVYVWGHSMGTGVATRLTAELSDEGRAPEALILESPFNNLREVIRGHPFSQPLRVVPWFDTMIVDPLKHSGLLMATDERIRRVTCPILILHAADDHIIPVELARKLVATAREAKRRVKYVEFESEYKFKHKFIHRHEGLPALMERFLADADLPADRRRRNSAAGTTDT